MATHALDALGNPVRRSILESLRQRPRSVGELAEMFPVSRPAISRHLRLLQDAELVAHRTVGRQNLYQLRHDGLEEARAFLDGMWGDALSRFKLVAENVDSGAARRSRKKAR
jgi:DNA-binding transcriptional ArsR family regulator